MQHVHWWLFALSFFLGLGLTFLLLKKSRPAVESESPTTKIVVAEDPPTTKIVVAEDPSTTKIPVPEDPPTTKIPVAKETPTQKIPTVPFAPYGPGSARAGAEGGGPAGWLVKGRSDTRLYYTPDDATYERTVAQVWFKDEEFAMRAYFTAWRKSSRK
jgi:uncharacterized membrane protein ArfC